MVCGTYFNIYYQLDGDVFNFHFVDILANVLATFPQIGQFSFQSSGHSDWEFLFHEWEWYFLD